MQERSANVSWQCLADSEEGWQEACGASGDALGCVLAQDVHPDTAQGGHELQPAHDSRRLVQRQVQSTYRSSGTSMVGLAAASMWEAGLNSSHTCTHAGVSLSPVGTQSLPSQVPSFDLHKELTGWHSARHVKGDLLVQGSQSLQWMWTM